MLSEKKHKAIINAFLVQIPRQIKKMIGPLSNNLLGGYPEQSIYEFPYLGGVVGQGGKLVIYQINGLKGGETC